MRWLDGITDSMDDPEKLFRERDSVGIFLCDVGCNGCRVGSQRALDSRRA